MERYIGPRFPVEDLRAGSCCQTILIRNPRWFMPFIRDLSGEYDEDADFGTKANSGYAGYISADEYRYEDVTDELQGPPRVILDSLIAAGATEFRVNYDGGCDEGFAHAESVRIGGRLRCVEDVVDDL